MEKENVEKQIDRATEDYQNRLGQRYAVRNFSVTVWVAVLIAIATKTLKITICGKCLLLIIPVIMFWFFELTLASITQRRESFICSLENRLAKNDMDSENPIEIYYMSMDKNIRLKKKFYGLVKALCSTETSNLFYSMQIFVSIIFLYSI